MTIHRGCLLVGALSLLTVHSAIAAEARLESREFSILHDGAVVPIEAGVSSRLAVQTIAYFDTCHTRESVVGNAPSDDAVRQQWEEAASGTHALLQLYGADGRTDLLVGFSADSAAWPVIQRQDDRYVDYLRCDGLQGLLLACEVGEALSHSVVPPAECDRLREIERQESTEDESTMPEGAG